MDNRLLTSLRPAEFDMLAPSFEDWSGGNQDVLFEPGDLVDYTYFPCGQAMVSFRVVFANGASIETGLVGREGAVGGIVSHGHLPAFARAIVQFGGPFIRLRTARLEEAKMLSPTIHHLFSRYADCLLAQLFQTGACNACHTIEQRTAKWILAALDRTENMIVPLTQEQLAGMLGVGRSYINRVVKTWKDEGLVAWRRGQMVIIQTETLRARECTCNAAIKTHFQTVLDGLYPY